jgi:hypothetical protein
MSRRWYNHSHVRVPFMPRDAVPIQLSTTFRFGDVDAAVRNRNLDCSEYDTCLVYAAAEGWQNFTCRRCARFRAEESETPLTLQSSVSSHVAGLGV